jgi:hypothetical protein
MSVDLISPFIILPTFHVVSQLANVTKTQNNHESQHQQLNSLKIIAEHFRKAENSLWCQARGKDQDATASHDQAQLKSLFRPLPPSVGNYENKSLLVRLKLPIGTQFPAVEAAKNRLLVRLKLPMGIVQSFEQEDSEERAKRRSLSSASTRLVTSPAPEAPMLGYFVPPSIAAVPGDHASLISSQNGAVTRYDGVSKTKASWNAAKPMRPLQLLNPAGAITRCSSTSGSKVLTKSQICHSLPTPSTTSTRTPGVLSVDLGPQGMIPSDSQTSDSSILSHITVAPYTSESVTTSRQGSPPDGILPVRKKPRRTSKAFTNGNFESLPEEEKLSEQLSIKQVTAVSSTPESDSDSDSDDDVPLVQLIRQRKRKRECTQSSENSDDDAPLRSRRLRHCGSLSERRIRTVVLDDEENDFYVPEFAYDTRSKSGIQSASTSNSPVKRQEIVYDHVRNVIIQNAIFPVKVKHPTLPGTLWEIENAGELQEEIDKRKFSTNLPVSPRIQTHAQGFDRSMSMPNSSLVPALGQSPLVIFMDQAEEEFGNNLFFVISTAKHTTTHPLSDEGGQIVDDAAQAWLDTLRRGRKDFEEKIRPLGLLGRLIKKGSTKKLEKAENTRTETVRDGKVAMISNGQGGRGQEGEVEADFDLLGNHFEPIREHLQLIPQLVKDNNLTRDEKIAKIRASLFTVGDFIENKITGPMEQEERLQL